MFYEVQIVPVASGGGQWQVSSPQGEGWVDAEDLVADMAQGPWTLYELGVDTLPEGVEDIRGTVQGAPFRLFALVHDADVWANVQYVGIVAKA